VSRHFPAPEERGHHTIFPGVLIDTVAGQQLMLSLVDLAPHSVVEEHSHPHEQTGLWLQGRAEFTIGDEVKVVQPGDMYHIPSNVRHKVVVLDQPARALDVFTPVRDEYR
jgi:quercetin dioxygenase-like cupin family protein